MKTKEKILKAALDLFNIEGIELVTTRDIAAKTGISQGNLHYHYPNKNLLLEILFEEYMQQLNAAERYKGNGMLKEEILLSMKDNFQVIQLYRFTTLDRAVLWRRVPEAKKPSRNLYNEKRAIS